MKNWKDDYINQPHSAAHQGDITRFISARSAGSDSVRSLAFSRRRTRLQGSFSGRTVILVSAVAFVLALLMTLLWAGGVPASADGGQERPAKPAGLQLTTEPASLEVSADWDDVQGVTHYLVRWRQAGSEGNLNEGVPVESSEADITMVGFGEWVVRVQACNDSGCGPPMSQTAATTPAQPTNLAVNVTAGEMDLSVTWDAAEGASTYSVQWRRYGEALEDGNLVETTETSSTAEVHNYGRWVVRVRACAGTVCGPVATETVTVTPAQPKNLAVEASGGKLDLSVAWDAMEDASTYSLRWRRTGQEFEVSDTATTSANSTDIKVAAFGTWIVWVQACAGGVCGPAVTQRVVVEQPKPERPANLAVSASAGELDMAASWVSVAGATSYRVRWRRPTGNYDAVNQLTTTETSAAITVSDYGEWEVTVEACNDAGCGTPIVRKITLIKVNHAPTIEGAAAHSYAAHRKNAVATYTASDPEGEDIIWSLPSGADVGKFSINGSGELRFRAAPDYASPGDADADNRYQVTVRASDGVKHADLAVTVTVTRGNQPPAFTSGPTAASVAENWVHPISYTAIDPEGDEITWSVAGTDGDRFHFSSATFVSFQVIASLDFREVPEFERSDDDPNWDHDRDHVYNIIVRVSDQHSSTEMAVTVTVTNVDEPPVLAGPAEVLRQEGSDLGVTTYSASDPEGDSVVWSLGGADAEDFTIAEGVLSFIQGPNFGTPHDSDGDNVYELTVQASDGTDKRALSTEKVVRVTVAAATNSLWISNPWSNHVFQENGTTVVATYTAADPQDRPVTWSLEGDDAVHFTIGSTSGELKFASPPDYDSPADADGDNTYEFTVKATAGSDSDSRASTVRVTDIDEPPTLYGAAEVSHPGGSARKVAIYSAFDPENLVIHWDVTGIDANDFLLRGQELGANDAVLKFKEIPDYDNPTDEDGDNVYLVTINARNHESFASKITPMNVRVTVTDPEKITSPQLPPRPTGLTIAAQSGALNMPVSWSEVTGATYYKLRWRRHDGSFESGKQAITGATSVAISVSGHGKWVVQVEACNYAGCGPGISEMVSNNRAAALTPKNFVVSGTPGKLNLTATWKAAANATSYTLRWRLAGESFAPENQVVVTSTEATFNVSGVGDWVVRLKGCNDDECGPATAVRFQVEPDPQPNRKPVVDEQAEEYKPFAGRGNAPRGVLVSKIFDGIFSDPEGDPLTFAVSVSDDRRQLVESVYVREELQRVFIRLKADGDWGAITPALTKPLITTVTLTATDPEGLTASVTGEFLTRW